jgi:hypothetical protein
LVQSIRALKPDACRLEEVELHFCPDVSLVAIDAAMMVFELDILHVVDVMHARLGKVV